MRYARLIGLIWVLTACNSENPPSAADEAGDAGEGDTRDAAPLAPARDAETAADGTDNGQRDPNPEPEPDPGPDPEPDDCRAERCNNRDDDCDRRVDEADPAIGTPCGIGEGDCAREGRVTCRDGMLQCDAPMAAPTAELCNGDDDDCDGEVDEGFDVGRACDEGIGLCLRPGRIRCDGVTSYCDAAPGRPQAELCDGADDDCDGRIDEALPGSAIIRNDWIQEVQYSAACNLVLTEFPVMYVSVDCRLDDPGCQNAAIEGPGAALFEGAPGRHTVHARCCLIDGTRCFGQDRSCSLPGSPEVYPCTCLEGSFNINLLQCDTIEFAACSR